MCRVGCRGRPANMSALSAAAEQLHFWRMLRYRCPQDFRELGGCKLSLRLPTVFLPFLASCTLSLLSVVSSDALTNHATATTVSSSTGALRWSRMDAGLTSRIGMWPPKVSRQSACHLLLRRRCLLPLLAFLPLLLPLNQRHRP